MFLLILPDGSALPADEKGIPVSAVNCYSGRTCPVILTGQDDTGEFGMPGKGRDRRVSITQSQIRDSRARAQKLMEERRYADTLMVDRELLQDLIRCADLLDQLLTAQDRRKS